MHDLNDIPQSRTENFPSGVTEQIYHRQDLMIAFIDGLNFADDIDVSHGEIFERDGQFVVRVKVGDPFEDDDSLWKEFEDQEEDDSLWQEPRRI